MVKIPVYKSLFYSSWQRVPWVRVIWLVALLSFAIAAEAITLQQAARQVARQYDGKVVAARTIEQNGRRIHVIRVVTKQGVVKTVRIPE